MILYVAPTTSGTCHTSQDCRFLRHATVREVTGVPAPVIPGRWFYLGTDSAGKRRRKPVRLCSACEGRS